MTSKIRERREKLEEILASDWAKGRDTSLLREKIAFLKRAETAEPGEHPVADMKPVLEVVLDRENLHQFENVEEPKPDQFGVVGEDPNYQALAKIFHEFKSSFKYPLVNFWNEPLLPIFQWSDADLVNFRTPAEIAFSEDVGEIDERPFATLVKSRSGPLFQGRTLLKKIFEYYAEVVFAKKSFDKVNMSFVIKDPIKEDPEEPRQLEVFSIDDLKEDDSDFNLFASPAFPGRELVDLVNACRVLADAWPAKPLSPRQQYLWPLVKLVKAVKEVGHTNYVNDFRSKKVAELVQTIRAYVGKRLGRISSKGERHDAQNPQFQDRYDQVVVFYDYLLRLEKSLGATRKFNGVRFEHNLDVLDDVCDLTASCFSSMGNETVAQLLYRLDPSTHIFHVNLYQMERQYLHQSFFDHRLFAGSSLKHIVFEGEDSSGKVLVHDGCVGGLEADMIHYSGNEFREQWFDLNFRSLVLFAQKNGYSRIIFNTSHSRDQQSTHDFVRYVAEQIGLQDGSDYSFERKGRVREFRLFRGLNSDETTGLTHTHRVRKKVTQDFTKVIDQINAESKKMFGDAATPYDGRQYLTSFYEWEKTVNPKNPTPHWNQGEGLMTGLEVTVAGMVFTSLTEKRIKFERTKRRFEMGDTYSKYLEDDPGPPVELSQKETNYYDNWNSDPESLKDLDWGGTATNDEVID
ncbi:MAG: hypothetical protein H6502_01725 [Candidatus Woesearchaeota archaeon]|nr:MAG: hypothetical protein H6502_01725 [Candidatus Woesearchaeota archaeon]